MTSIFLTIFLINTYGQSFSFSSELTDTYLEPDDTIYVFHASVTNHTDSLLYIRGRKSTVHSPVEWHSTMCFGYCYGKETTSTDNTPVEANSSMDFELDVNITAGIEDYFEEKMVMNCSQTNESHELTFKISTTNTAIHSNTDTPTYFKLGQNFPNPFNPSTNIPIELTENREIRLDIYNLLGQKVQELFSGSLYSGSHVFQWNAIDYTSQKMPAGIYYYKLQIFRSNQDIKSFTKKMLLLK